jgi:hypothetical protein
MLRRWPHWVHRFNPPGNPAMMVIAQHHGRPHTPTDQAWIESFFGHINDDWPRLQTIRSQQTDSSVGWPGGIAPPGSHRIPA